MYALAYVTFSTVIMMILANAFPRIPIGFLLIDLSSCSIRKNANVLHSKAATREVLL